MCTEIVFDCVVYGVEVVCEHGNLLDKQKDAVFLIQVAYSEFVGAKTNSKLAV